MKWSVASAVVVLTLSLSMVLVGCSQPKDAEAHYEAGVKLLEEERWEEAAAEFTEAISLRTDYAEAYTRRAEAHLELVQPESAIDDATEAIRLNPGHAKAYSVRGMAQIERFVYEVSGVPLGDLLTATHSARGELESALQDFDRAIQLDPKLADAFFGRGLVQLALENFSAAMSDIDEALSMESRLSEDLVAIGYFLRAGLHTFEEQFQKAIEDMDRAIGLSRVPGSGVRGRGSGERETTASSLARIHRRRASG